MSAQVPEPATKEDALLLLAATVLDAAADVLGARYPDGQSGLAFEFSRARSARLFMRAEAKRIREEL